MLQLKKFSEDITNISQATSNILTKRSVSFVINSLCFSHHKVQFTVKIVPELWISERQYGNFILSEREFSFSQEADMGKEIFCRKQRVFLSVTFLSPLLLWTSGPSPVLSGSLTADYYIRFSTLTQKCPSDSILRDSHL